MKTIESILKEKGLKINDLHYNLQEAVQNSKNLYAEIEEKKSAITDESSEDDINELEELKHDLTELNNHLAEIFDDVIEEKAEAEAEAAKAEAEAKDEAEAPVKEEKQVEPKPQKQPEPKPVEAAVEVKPEKKLGIGAFLLGAAVLVLTAGAVNVMNKR